MLIANTDIVTDGKTFQRGQIVSGLSSLDRQWMLASGYISEATDLTAGKKGRKTQKPELDSGETQVERQEGNEF